MQAAAYIRVSTKDQAGEDRFGLADQREIIQRYADAEGIDVTRWYSDEGVSGATVDRDGLQEMLLDAEHGKIQQVIVAKLDRVARDLYIQLWVEKEFMKADVKLVSASEPYSGNNPMETAFRQMAGVFAELEKNMIAMRLKGGRRQKARQGGYAGGKPAIGYTAARGDKILKLDPQKAGAVRRAFELRRSGMTFQSIADALNQEGHRTAQDCEFKRMQVKRIIDREELYSGQYSYADVRSEGIHEPILS